MKYVLALLTFWFNARFWVQYFLISFKTAQTIMFKQSDKLAEKVPAYKPIFLFPIVFKLFVKHQ